MVTSVLIQKYQAQKLLNILKNLKNDLIQSKKICWGGPHPFFTAFFDLYFFNQKKVSFHAEERYD